MKRTIKSIRIDLGLTQEEMAKTLNISTTSYLLKENGKREFTASEFTKICEIANVPSTEVVLVARN